MFAGLRWEKDIRSLGNPHVLFSPSSEHDKRAGNHVVMTTSLLYIWSLHKHGGGGCRKSRNNTKKLSEKRRTMYLRRTLM
jgi:hypothetical protein